MGREMLKSMENLPAGEIAIWAAERLLTAAHAAPVGVEVGDVVDGAIQLQALEMRKEGLPTCEDFHFQLSITISRTRYQEYRYS